VGNLKGPSEGGSGGKRGHRNMEHWGFNDEVKDAARARRRLDDNEFARQRQDPPEDWTRLKGQHVLRFAEEAAAEMGPGHELFGSSLTAISTCPGCDDVLFRLADRSFAIVRLTWSGEREAPPWPKVKMLGG